MTVPAADPATSPSAVSAAASQPDPATGPQAERGESGPARHVLPLVVRIERADPPSRTDALETAARAVLLMLSDPRTVDEGGAWHRRVRLWEDSQIRKVVRRARGAEWRRTQPLEGLTVTGDGAEVRVFPPVPLDSWPKELARLQVSGTDLAETAPVAAPAPGTPVLWLNPGLGMSAGKAMAQAGHGAQLAWWELDDAARTAWRDAGFPLAVRPARDAAHWAELTGGGLPVVHDAGYTEIAPGATVAVEWRPPAGRAPGEAR